VRCSEPIHHHLHHPVGGWAISLHLVTVWVPFDKDEGIVKTQNTRAMRQHRDVRQLG
jgi:hypothetical protein